MRWVTLCLLLLVGTVAVFLWEPGSGAVQRRYDEIVAGMTEQDVSAVLGAERDREIAVLFNFGIGESELRTASVWTFTIWGRPFYVLVGYDSHGVVSWKKIRKGAFKKFGYWVFNEKADYFQEKPPMWIEVVNEHREDGVDRKNDPRRSRLNPRPAGGAVLIRRQEGQQDLLQGLFGNPQPPLIAFKPI
jgi:hypothetical protein